ncbi:Fruit protein [Chlorella vulgaris]
MLQANPVCSSSTACCSTRRPLKLIGGRLAQTPAQPQRQGARSPQQLRVGSAAADARAAAEDRKPKDDDDDLWQFADREKWYQATFCAVDQPDWNPARFVRSSQIAPGVREVVLECEISREKVPLRNAYKHVGQRASVRVNSGVNMEAAVVAPPFPQLLNRDALLRVRGDIHAGETKTVKEEISVLVELPLYVREEEQPELYKMTAEDGVEVGPFTGGGLQLRGPISAVFLFPTIVMFVEGAGIAAAKALIEAGTDQAGLGLRRRQDVRMYYRAPNEAALCYRERYDEWGSKYGVRVLTSTRDSFADMFDDDETLMYEPDTTAAIILTGDDEEAEAAAAEVCKEAEIGVVVRQSEEVDRTTYLIFGKPQDLV